MKRHLLTLTTAILLSISGYAQAPEAFNYQAVVRDAVGDISANASVSFRLSILQTSAGGTSVYSETHAVTTNGFGLANLSVGTGTVVSGDFSLIDWSADIYFLQVELDPAGGSSYQQMGTSQLLSVPYALHATTAANTFSGDYNDLINTPSMGTDDHTLDSAYDAGGAGAGRTINADNGRVDIFATGNRGLQISSDPAHTGLYVWGTTAAQQTSIYGSASTNAHTIWADNTGAGASLYGTHNSTGRGLYVSHLGAGIAAHLEPSGAGHGLQIDKPAGQNGVPLLVNTLGNEGAVNIQNGGTGDALIITSGGSGDNGIDLLYDGNTEGILAVINNGTGMLLDNAGPGMGIHAFNGNPTNGAEVGLFRTMGTGRAGAFIVEDNNSNNESALFAQHSGTGSAAQFLITDDPGSPINTMPAVDIMTEGKGIGINIMMNNTFGGGASNTEPGILSTHRGYGSAGYFTTDNTANTSSVVDIINGGTGMGLHIESQSISGANSETALSVEQADFSTAVDKGRVAHFDLQNSATAADAAVLISSVALDPAHCPLKVVPWDPSAKAACFEGSVDVANDLIIGDSLWAVNGGFQNLTVTTTFTAPAKAFKIDHPLHPEEQFLVHNSIESNERVNIYSGNVTTDEEGFATVTMPDYMSALNTDFRYQLTVMDRSFAQAVIWEELEAGSNTFKIRTNEPNISVSWQLTGVRHDTWAKENPLRVEVKKQEW